MGHLTDNVAVAAGGPMIQQGLEESSRRRTIRAAGAAGQSRASRLAAWLLLLAAPLGTARLSIGAEETVSEGRRLLEEGVELRRAKPAEARPPLERALATLASEGDLAGQAEAHRNLGILERLAGRDEEALRRYETALDLARRSGDDKVRSEVLNSLGILHRHRQDYDRALAVAAEGLDIAGRGGDQVSQARLLGSIVRIHDETGRLEEAERTARLALALARRGDAPSDLLVPLMGNLAAVLAKRGEMWEALRLHDRIDELPGLPEGSRWDSDNTRALIHRSLGDHERAELFARRALESVRREGGISDQLAVQFNLALILQDRGDVAGAARLLEESWSGLIELGASYRALHAANALATLALVREETAAAADWNRRALKLAAAAGVTDPRPLEEAQATRSRISAVQGDTEAARIAAEEALRLADLGGDPNVAAEARERLGELGLAGGEIEKAEALFREAIAIRSDLQARLPYHARMTLPRRHSSGWRLLAFSLLDRSGSRPDLVPEAASLMDAGRSGAFLEMLSEAGATGERDIARTHPGEGFREAERAIARIQGRLLEDEPDERRRATLRRELLLAEERLAAAGRDAGIARPRPVSRPAQPRYEELGGALAEERAVLVRFGLGPDRGWVVIATPESLKAVPIAGADRITPVAAGLEALLNQPGGGLGVPDPMPALERLSELILEPWLHRLPPQTNRILIVPDEILERVPFEALRIEDQAGTGRRYLIERYSVGYAPSGASWLAMRRRASRARPGVVLAIADPRLRVRREEVEGSAARPAGLPELPASRKEAARLVALGARGSRLLVAETASEAAWKGEDLSRFQLIHVAAHGIADVAHPMRSGLILGSGDPDEDGLVQMREILQHSLAADLVVLSACRSAVGPLDRAEGIISLPLAFLEAGARAVLATLWDVGDETAAGFMNRFYGAIARGVEPAQALQEAKLEMIRSADPSLEWPGAWAPFILVGATGGELRVDLHPPGRGVWPVITLLALLTFAWLVLRSLQRR